jgi:hypothetical protein
MGEETFNTRAAVQFFGGPADLQRRMRKLGYTLSVKGIEKWQERGQIPGNWMVRMAKLAREEGRLFDIHDFIVPGEAA